MSTVENENYFHEKIRNLFGKEEAESFMTESQKLRPLTIRTNLLKILRKDLIKALTQRGVELEPIEWSIDGIIVYNSKVPLGATPEYLNGLYAIQGAASFLPVLNLMSDYEKVKKENEAAKKKEIEYKSKKSKSNGKKRKKTELEKNNNTEEKEQDVASTEEVCDINMRVLDMCAAPGGKTTHLAVIMEDSGILFACDDDSIRIKALQSNIQRMNITNTMVICMDARKIPVENYFDYILLDAPCSGTGVLSKDSSVINRDRVDVRDTVKLQKELILKAFKMLKKGGKMVYSTCSVLEDENEEVVNYLLGKKIGAKILEVSTDIGKPGLKSFRGNHYHPSMTKTRRIYPHVHNMDGFFYAKITKN